MSKITNTGAWNYMDYSLEQDLIDKAHLEKELIDYLLPFIKEEKIFIDIGCGKGHYLHYLTTLISDVEFIGIEPLVSGIPGILNYDLTIPFDLEKRGNVFCFEVLEHIDPMFEKIAIKNVVKHCNNYLFISWAHEGQLGEGHINEKNKLEVINLFKKEEFKYLFEESEKAKSFCKAWWIQKNICIFKMIK